MSHKPIIPKKLLEQMLVEIYGIRAEITALPGYEDLNFTLQENGNKSILKITTDPNSLGLVDAQIRVLEFLGRNPDIRSLIPEVYPGLDGTKLQKWESKGQIFYVRRLSFLEGTFLGEINPPLSFFHSLGTIAGALDKELLNIDEPVFRSRELVWDLRKFPELEDLDDKITDPYGRTLVRYFFMKYRDLVAPIYPNLRKSVIHSDFNDWNILCNEDRLSGLIDFGDMVYSATIHELAIALAYSMMDKDDPLAVAVQMISGYHQKLPLLKEEIEILYYLVAARLCTTVVMAADQASNDPENDYYQISTRPAWELLNKWIKINPLKAETCFKEACDLEIPEATNSPDEILSERKKYFPGSLSVSYREPISMLGSALQYMYDDKGNTYLDGVNNIPHVGHCHPRIVEAGKKQMARLNTNTRYLYDSLNEYARKLLDKFPDPLNKIIFVNSGSAATDLAIRLARTHTGRDQFIVLDHAYHGNTSTAIGLSPYKFNHKGGSGKPDNVHIAPIPDPYRGKYKTQDLRPKTQDAGYFGHKYADEVRNMISGDEVLKNNLAGFIAESIPGCGGQICLPENYLGEVYEEIRKNGGICIADEVQTGFGRVGHAYWGFELYDVVPDIVILGKPMGNGHPIGAVVFTDEISSSFENGLEFFSSFGGNPVSCEIGLAVLDAIEEDGLLDNARKVGDFLLSEISRIQKDENRRPNPVIGNVRGSGLFIGIELVSDIYSREPNPVKASEVVNEMKSRGILLSTDGPDENVIKFKPPLCFTMENAKELIEKLSSVFL